MQHGVIWEELGNCFTNGETEGPEEGRAMPGLQAELRLEAEAVDLLAWRMCICMCVGYLLHPSTISSLAQRGGCMWDPDSMVGS